MKTLRTLFVIASLAVPAAAFAAPSPKPAKTDKAKPAATDATTPDTKVAKGDATKTSKKHKAHAKSPAPATDPAAPAPAK